MEPTTPTPQTLAALKEIETEAVEIGRKLNGLCHDMLYCAQMRHTVGPNGDAALADNFADNHRQSAELYARLATLIRRKAQVSATGAACN